MKEQLQAITLERPSLKYQVTFRCAEMYKLADRGNKERSFRGEGVGKPLELKKQDIVLKDGIDPGRK